MNDIKNEFFADREMWGRRINLHMRVKDGDKFSVAERVTIKEVSEGEFYSEPFIKLTIAEARKLMDELWQAGIRPSNGEGSTGQLAATERHLSDMRSIAMFKVGLKP